MQTAAFTKHLFQYEQDKYYPLRRIPMNMRLKLDLCGIKLSIGDWSKFSREDREKLVMMPYEKPEEIAAIRKRLLELIAACEGDSTETEPVRSPAPWTATSSVPATVCKQIEALGLSAPTQEQWADLSDVQRFALLKLTREGHENKKLPLALKEFGLLV
ncbi:nitrate reductase associated protein [Oxalobacteraceae bacterium R-40]|uniref:Nitrate reductase associated protein n=1 Tax=Keguizhuia sedimenti TaxID=3064264 RepID=A0ABU1BJU0_9BURK|nr:nitrate reductase associated protein [Oxalobacteraceae bacterium R-40]